MVWNHISGCKDMVRVAENLLQHPSVFQTANRDDIDAVFSPVGEVAGCRRDYASPAEKRNELFQVVILPC